MAKNRNRFETAEPTDATPNLLRLVTSGAVWREGSEWVGRAADGTVVNFGIGNIATEEYLVDHPTPEEW